MIKVDWRERSSIRGAIWFAGGIVAMVFAWFGKDSTAVMGITATVAGGLGLALKDKA